uniref:Uncharacterized protein n=1 Tax=Meloidogyne enterolobii TaxID=390850 RepID=A0A6V7VVA0_MELEN|nr:unnamed protein product [Meloidogyne enterolobii]
MRQYEQAKQQQDHQFAGLLNPTTNFHRSESYYLNNGRFEGSNYQNTLEASKKKGAGKAKNYDLNGPAPQKAGRKTKTPKRSPMN